MRCDICIEKKNVKEKISTHTSRVGCDIHSGENWESYSISTHTSRVGCDLCTWQQVVFTLGFLLTHPVWDVTGQPTVSARDLHISTHTSRVGCDFISH